MTRKQRKTLVRILVSAALLAGAVLIPVKAAKYALYAASYGVIGYDILIRAGKGIWNRQVFDENFLMAVATLGAIALAFIDGSMDFNEAVLVMLLYQIGEWFQSLAVGRSRRSIAALMDIRPDYANIEIDGTLTQVDPDEVEIGSVIVCQPGEKIPIDGIVEDGASTLNTAALTGESVPREVIVGSEVISGCVNLTGVLKIRTTKAFGESTVSKILELVENSTSRKSKSENFISKFARIYTPAVCLSALALAILPPVARLLLNQPALWGDWLYRALSFLIISCPCALVISIPLTFFAGIGAASRQGILVKGSNYLEALSKTETVVFDKTGTLTRGTFEVSGIHHNEIENEALLELAALAESASSHPIGKSLQAACGRPLDRSRVSGIEEISGCGITAKVDGRAVAVGNDRLMRRLGIAHKDCHSVGTIVHIAVDGAYAGHIVISDAEKPTAAAAIADLRAVGAERIVMLTGDIQRVASHVGERLGVDEIRAELLPADKVSALEALLTQKRPKATLAFVGDGINDAPVLSRADIGIAMGAMGSDAAIEAADVVLMDDDPRKVAAAIRLARHCRKIVVENIAFALAVKAVCLLLSALGLGNMALAIFADVGVMVLAVLNALRR